MGPRKLLFGLIGYPLDHSWSPEWFTEKFKKDGGGKKDYRLFPLTAIEEFPGLLVSYPELAGLNVTIPFKEKIIPYLDELDETARRIGAVNTIKISRNNGVILTKGFNTDAAGFLQTLTDHIPEGPALIIGTGGGAKAVACALTEKEIPFLYVSRDNKGSGIISYHDLTPEVICHHLFIINTTPLGMYPDTGTFPPIPYHHLSDCHFLYDLIYNPGETEFLKRGKAMKTRTMNGRQMLFNQAELSYQIFLK
jgi:shikimate dehydrogenase